MPDFFDLLARWWKQILLVPLFSLVTVGIITFLKPKQYLSVATAIPASSYTADKGHVFNDRIQALYSAFGTADDLDRIIGTADLDTVYTAVAGNFNLYDHYKTKETGPAAVRKAASLLRKNTRVIKSTHGELKVKVWDTDPDLAPQLANAIVDQLQRMHQDLQASGNKATLEGLLKSKKRLQQEADTTAFSADLANRIRLYDNYITEYQLILDARLPVLLVVERAVAASWPDRPKRFQVLTATAVLSILFSLLAALALDRKKTARQ